MIHRSLFIALLWVSVSQADIALDASVGSTAQLSSPADLGLDFVGHLWYQFDQMVFFGPGGGVQTLDGIRTYPLLGSAFLRLPIGGQVLPIATGDWGWSFGKKTGFQWNVGGGLDIKNGDHSSLLVLGGFREFAQRGSYYARAGLLLEF